jgi:group I intron endonuclease
MKAIKTSGIYAITHLETGRVYVGKSIDIERRWHEHKRDARRGVEMAIYNALRKYGAEAFEWKVLEVCQPHALDSAEIRWIKELRSFDSGFNCTPGGDGLRAGSKHSEAANLAKSLRQRGKPKSPEAILAASAPRKGRPMPASVIAAAADFNRGRPRHFSKQHRERLSAAKRGKPMPPGALQKAWVTRKANAMKMQEVAS